MASEVCCMVQDLHPSDHSIGPSVDASEGGSLKSWDPAVTVNSSKKLTLLDVSKQENDGAEEDISDDDDQEEDGEDSDYILDEPLLVTEDPKDSKEDYWELCRHPHDVACYNNMILSRRGEGPYKLHPVYFEDDFSSALKELTVEVIDSIMASDTEL